jgi:4-diphosphocytidyl-2-C-methyl-D-erythritol kinase
VATLLTAPAKLTTHLRVTGLRPDGLHLIDAEMVSLDVADILEVDEANAPTTTFAMVDEGGGARVDVVPEDNLVLRALAMTDRQPTSITLRKRIPAGGGLGGGSSDAAAVLRWAGFDDLAAAAALGADVAFCLVGGRATVGGIGELVEPQPFEARTYTLVLPTVGCSTPAVYRAWDEMGGPTGEHGNDLEPAALRVEPMLARWRDQLGDETGQQPRLAGSGSTWFVEGAYPNAGIVTHTVPAGWTSSSPD